MFWEQFWANYLSSVLAGITLGLIGVGAYKSFKSLKKNQNILQFAQKGANINIQSDSTAPVNIKIINSPTTEDDKQISSKYVEREY